MGGNKMLKFKVGDRVKHPEMGKGTIREVDKDDENMPYRIQYDIEELRWYDSNVVTEIGGSMPKYDEKTTQAINDSMKHHENNLHQLKTLKGEFSIGWQSYNIGKVSIDFTSTSCALCRLFRPPALSSSCNPSCPLELNGFSCDKDGSPWKILLKPRTKEKAIEAEENMVKVLKGLLEEEAMFKKGDKARCWTVKKANDISDSVWLEVGKVYEVKDVDEKGNIGIGSCYYNPKCFTKEAEMSKYDELKKRIAAVTAWDEEADNIMQEMLNPKDRYYICMPTFNSNPSGSGSREISIFRNNAFPSLADKKESFSYSSQCEKLDAFKKALMWLLDNSDIKKDIVGQEVKADIEGKIYKVKVLKEV